MGFLGKNFGWGRDDKAVTATAPATAAKRTTRERGNAAEDRALAHLLAARLTLMERNYRTPGRGGGEIDLVMRDRDGTLVFVEVRSRASRAFGGAGGSIGQVKQQRIVLAARHYLLRWPAPPACRFDAVLVEGPSAAEIEWLRGAFDAG
ncbi:MULTISPECIES: YraN family protein [unclassified Acidovorax]|uniref:YraN family protein n=1 Tax=unclassified Acidovorax TaxID=2684926 RepID=UPI002882DF44|nr:MULTISPECIES: YraN family protein [unclassified Acidovorax]